MSSKLLHFSEIHQPDVWCRAAIFWWSNTSPFRVWHDVCDFGINLCHKIEISWSDFLSKFSFQMSILISRFSADHGLRHPLIFRDMIKIESYFIPINLLFFLIIYFSSKSSLLAYICFGGFLYMVVSPYVLLRATFDFILLILITFPSIFNKSVIFPNNDTVKKWERDIFSFYHFSNSFFGKFEEYIYCI